MVRMRLRCHFATAAQRLWDWCWCCSWALFYCIEVHSPRVVGALKLRRTNKIECVCLAVLLPNTTNTTKFIYKFQFSRISCSYHTARCSAGCHLYCQFILTFELLVADHNLEFYIIVFRRYAFHVHKNLDANCSRRLTSAIGAIDKRERVLWSFIQKSLNAVALATSLHSARSEHQSEENLWKKKTKKPITSHSQSVRAPLSAQLTQR